MGKLRLCERCGISLTLMDGLYHCPRGHGSWTAYQVVSSYPVRHPVPNGKTYETGARDSKAGSKSGRKRKKPPKKTPNIYLDL